MLFSLSELCTRDRRSSSRGKNEFREGLSRIFHSRGDAIGEAGTVSKPSICHPWST